MKIYVASSWKNNEYFELLRTLRTWGYDPLDWREKGFGWNQVSDKPITEVTGAEYRDIILQHPRAVEGFNNDKEKMEAADCCVLLLPCGRSAHLEAGWFWGKEKPLHIFIPVFDTPELMYKSAVSINFTIEELRVSLQ